MAAVTSSKNTMLETLLFMVYLRKLLTQSCDDRCVALDWKYNGVSPRRFECCSQRPIHVFYTIPLCFLVIK